MLRGPSLVPSLTGIVSHEEKVKYCTGGKEKEEERYLFFVRDYTSERGRPGNEAKEVPWQ